jgi:hypothetical protein
VLIAISRGGDSDGGPGASGGASTTVGAAAVTTDEEAATTLASVEASTTTTLPPVTTSSSTTTSSTTTTLSPAAGDDWPEVDAYTVIVANYSVDDPTGESQAAAFRDQMLADGLDAGIIYSSGYSSLRPGWWAVFSGFFATAADARVHMQWLIDNGYPLAYAREVIR